ncbi:MAG: SurA N-terminal domain-containing protein, partial [Candidatus Omnitrophota bacterium]
MTRRAALFMAAGCTALAVFCGAASAESTGAANKILAVVNDEVLTQADLDIALGQIRADLENEYSGAELTAKVEAARKDYLNQMIEDKLILQEAKKMGVAVDDTEVEE